MFWILADCGIFVICFCVFANPSGFKLIVADQLACVFANFCGFKLAVAVQFVGMQANQAPSPLFPSEVSNLFGEYFLTALVQCDSQSAAAYRAGSHTWGCHGYLHALT